MGARASLWALVHPGVSKLVENDVPPEVSASGCIAEGSEGSSSTP